MEFEYKENILTVDNRTVVFDNVIKEIIDFNDILVVRTDYFKATSNENVFGINNYGEKVWQIQNLDKILHNGKLKTGIREPYSGIVRIDDTSIRLINLDGTKFEVNPRTGELLSNPINSRMGNRPW